MTRTRCRSPRPMTHQIAAAKSQCVVRELSAHSARTRSRMLPASSKFRTDRSSHTSGESKRSLRSSFFFAHSMPIHRSSNVVRSVSRPRRCAASEPADHRRVFSRTDRACARTPPLVFPPRITGPGRSEPSSDLTGSTVFPWSVSVTHAVDLTHRHHSWEDRNEPTQSARRHRRHRGARA